MAEKRNIILLLSEGRFGRADMWEIYFGVDESINPASARKPIMHK